MVIYPMGDTAVVVQFETDISREAGRQVRAFSSLLDEQQLPWLFEYVPAFTTITLYYDAAHYDYPLIEQDVKRFLDKMTVVSLPEGELIEIPVCYGGKFGEDIEYVAAHNGLEVIDVIDIHTAVDYEVYMIGFAPGFPYLGGMSSRIATPRQSEPRGLIPAGSVGIAGNQTGVYPLSSPGGWQLIGRTPTRLFVPSQHPPSLLKAGDKVRFYSISEQEFECRFEKEGVQ